MNLFEKLLYFLQGEMTTPKPFGWFHLLCILLMSLTIFFLYKRKNNYSQKQLKIVIGIYSVVALILEILKQLIWAFNYDSVTNSITWDYEWYAFPFQLCTTPLIVCIICLFLRSGKVRNALFSYISYITILGSISTILVPESCFVSDILVNIHTMWLHLGAFVISVYLLITKEISININNLKNALIVFIIFVFIALSLNIIIYNSGILNGETFNMFYISPYFISTIPIFDIIQENVPYLLFLFIYIFALSLGSFIIYNIAKVIRNIFSKV